MNTFSVPSDALHIIDMLHNAGEEAYIVGGCVRDLLLGLTPYDWDITTSATPEKVKSLFKRTIDTGIEHGTVTVMMDKTGYEVTTYRVDGEYEDYRRPKEVVFSRNLSEDLLRRDFTINAMAYNPYEGLVDPYGGLQDLEARLIRCVGNALDRFNEDALRMLRAIRFSAKLGFDIEIKTYDAIKELASLINHVSVERIQVELTKTLLSDQPEKIRELVNCGLIGFIFPEFQTIVGLTQNNPYHRKSVDEHTYETLNYVRPEARLRWSMYLHDVGKGYTKTTDQQGIDHFYGHQKISSDISNRFLKKMHFDNKTIDGVTKLVLVHDERINVDERSVRRAMSRIGIDFFEDFLEIKEADIKGQSFEYVESNLSYLEAVRKIYKKISDEKQCLTIKDLALNGRDIIALGFENGKIIGEILNDLLEFVLEEPSRNTPIDLQKRVIEIKNERQS